VLSFFRARLERLLPELLDDDLRAGFAFSRLTTMLPHFPRNRNCPLDCWRRIANW
jgi:hypothetical protein